MSGPLIGVTGPRGRGWGMWICAWLSLKLQGARAVRITRDQGPERWDRLDGLLIGGGDDISATLYGMEPAPDIRVDPDRDRLELEALERVWPTGAPVLGVCRGSQMLNIFRGGSLHQDIHAIYVEAPRMRTVLPRKRVRLLDGAALTRIIGAPEVTVNALHHQSIDRLGEGFAIAGIDEHGIVQATEWMGDGFRIGVQWHPEFLFYKRAHRRLFRAFVTEARRFRAARLRQQEAGSAEGAVGAPG